ncbi:disulfide-isomerase [Stylosanthes scabra]|uniref:protein disulfide-isomerase n=1 Tax=Stylosanthes scabra TaxID=79078 RepID=A0ABU6YFH0_9FABA|nr:disulfide-isomerase [Stylosanthes scabra]
MASKKVSTFFIITVFVFVFSLFTWFPSPIVVAKSESKEFVLTLDCSNFSHIVGNNEFIVIKFHAPWCGYCAKLAPEYEKAASILSSHDPPISLAKVDVNEEINRELANEFHIQGFPTLKILRSGGLIVQDYKGPRDAHGIVDYLKKQNGPASKEIESANDARDLIGENKVAIVGIFPEFSGDEFENFMELAKKLRSEYDFGHTLDANHLPHGDSSVTGPTVRLFKPFDELVVDFEDFNFEALLKFVEESSIPIVTVFDDDPNNHHFATRFFNIPHDKAMMFINFTADNADSLKSKYREAAEKYRQDGIKFLVADLEASEGAFEHFGVKKDQMPFIIIQHTDGRKYLKENVEPHYILAWFDTHKYGDIKPHRKSEPIPKVNDEPVKVVVADSLEEIVFSSRKNVFLELYAPWCGHCLELAPTLQEIAVSYQSDPDVIIAKMDATINDIPTAIFDVKGFPTLYFVSAIGDVLQYEGSRTKEDIIDFIEKNRHKQKQKKKGKVKVKDEL